MTRTYSDSIGTQLAAIAGYLNAQVISRAIKLKELAKDAGLSHVSVRAILDGKTANIASYMVVAEALGTDLLKICQELQAAVESPQAV